MLWLYDFFPYLSIEAINKPIARFNWAITNEASNQLPGTRSQYSTAQAMIETLPFVVADGPELRPIVYAMNDAARASKIFHGMTIASAKVLQHDLIVMPRDKTRELRTLKRVANTLLQFTPSVCIEENIDRAGIAMEISASLTLFGGLDALVARVQSLIGRMNYRARFGVAPTPLAASLFSRSANDEQHVPRCVSHDRLQQQLSPISVQHFAWPNDTLRSLSTLGLATMGDVLRQPYAGLQKRFGDAFVLDLDRALGRANDARKSYVAPETFESRIDFLYEIKDTDRLLPPIEELLIELEGFLRSRGAGVNEIRIEMKQGRSRSQSFEFHTRAPVRNASHWLRLVSDRIETHELDSPVVEIALFAQRIVELHEENESLLPQEKGTSSDWHTLLDRLASRLGEHNVYRIATIDDHRPELAWRNETDEALSSKSHALAQKTRPTWLLREPKSLVEMEGLPQYNGALTLLAGPERIDTGWWDNKPVARDYFVASNPQHEICWVFRDYRQGKRWYLHGFFS
jgi:protein ImuB